ncbi:MAG: AMP-binding protein [Solirubrobacterales bacterium]|nr:AMP-binding protein [Solirubrobacterales bacterium]
MTFSSTPLTPTAFLRRCAFVCPERLAVVDRALKLTYGELWGRTRRLAGALGRLEVPPGGRVAVLSANTHMMLEAHYGVPLGGAVLVALNMRLSPRELGYIIGHSESRVLLCDSELEALGREANAASGGRVRLIGASEYERLVEESPEASRAVGDERELLAINYTSGTTGRPKGVMYHHRGAYLQALAMAYHSALAAGSVYLWTLPMFHCNGWCFTWAVTAAGARHVCIPRPDPAAVWRLIDEEQVTHLCAAPTVLVDLASHAAAHRPRQPVRIATGGAPPSPALLARLRELSIDVEHLYGLTETFGPVMICDWKPEWDALEPERRARLKARQGVGNLIAEAPRVVTPDGSDVPADGQTLGEIVLRGNDLMLGYYRDPEATAAAAPDGWFHTGDLGVMHADGYVELRDRLKDVIISGGENIASVEVEQAISSHPSVLEVAVVARSDERFGERPVAFVRLVAGAQASERELIEQVRKRLAGFKAPDEVVFVESLPRTSTGKVQKFALRQQLREPSTQKEREWITKR